MRLNEIQNPPDEELFGATRLVREIARFLWQENIPSGKCIYPDRIENYIQPNPRLSRLWAAQSPATREFMADQIFAAMYQMEMDSFTESQDNNDDDMFGAASATAPKVQSILAAGIPLYITNIVSNDKDRQCRVKQLDYRVATFGQQKPYISFWLDNAQTGSSIIPWSDQDWQLQRTQDSFVLWPRGNNIWTTETIHKKLQETHSDDGVFAERSVSQKIMHLVQTGQPIYYVVGSDEPKDQWRLRKIIRATPKGYTWLNHSGITISYDYESFPVELKKLDDGKSILVPSPTRNVDESDTSDDELFGPRAVTRHSLQQMIDNDIPVYLRIQSNGEDARITEINPPIEGYPGYWMRYRSPTQRGMLAWRDRHWAVEPYRDGMILQQLPGVKMYESDSDEDLFGQDNLKDRLNARLNGAWGKIIDTLDELGPEAIFQNAKMFNKLYDKWDDGEHDPMEVMAYREPADKVLQAVAELEKIARDPYDYLEEHLGENTDDDMFSRPGEFAKNIKTQLTTLNDPYVRTVEIVKDLARQKFKVTTTVSYKSPRSPRRRATFFFGNHYDKNQAVGPKIKAELDAMGFESQFTGSHWLSVKVPPVFSNILGEDDDDELFGGRKLTPGYLKELLNTTGLWVEISGGEQFRVVEVGRVKQFPNEIAFRLLASYGEEFTVSYPPDMLRIDLTNQGSPVVHYGVLDEEHSDDMFSAQSKIQTLHLMRIFRAVEDLVTLTIVNVYPDDPRDDTLYELNKFMTRHNVSFKIVELALRKIASFDSFDEFYNEKVADIDVDELSEVKEPESDDDMFSAQSKLQTDSLRQIFRAVEDLVTLTIVNTYPEDPRDDTLNELNKFMTRHKVPFNIIELALRRIASFDSFEDFYNEMLHIYSQHYKDELGEVKEPESDEELFTPEKTLIVRGRDVANVLNKINFTTMSNVMNIKQEYMPQIREKIYSAILAYERGDVLEGNGLLYALTPRAFDYVRWSLQDAGLTSYAQRISEQRDQYQQDDMFSDTSRLTQNRFIGKIVIKLAEEIYNDPLSEQSDKEDAKDLQTVGQVFNTQGTRQGLTLIRQWADNGDPVAYDNVLSVLWQHGIDIGELEQQYQI